MDSIKIKDLIVPLAEYATIPEDATLFEAVQALKKARERFHPDKDPHEAVLVLDKTGQVVGQLSPLDIIRGLEPDPNKIGDLEMTSRFGVSPDFLKSLMKNSIWDRPLAHLDHKVSRIKVKAIMSTPEKGDFVKEVATLNDAIHQLAVTRNQSLLVTSGKSIVGILRLSDVFNIVCDEIMKFKT